MLKNSIRISLVLFTFLGALYMPPLVPLISAVLLCLLFRSWEVVLIGAMIDFLWLPVVPFHFPVATMLAIVIVWSLEPLRGEFLT